MIDTDTISFYWKLKFTIIKTIHLMMTAWSMLKHAQKAKVSLAWYSVSLGKSEAQNWLGISYQQLVNAVRPYLAEQMMTKSHE